MAQVEFIVTDLDDTLWCWCATWYAGFTAFNEALSGFGITTEQAVDAWTRMYLRVDGSTIEFPPNPGDLIESTRLSTAESLEAHSVALGASRTAREKAFHLFDGVSDTLSKIAEKGVPVIAHTDSPLSAAVHRLSRAGLDGAVHEVYGRPIFEDFGSSVALTQTMEVHTSHWRAKPDTAVLAHILESHDANPATTLYIGDSLRRDMPMAASLGCIPVWAKYGVEFPGRDEVIAALVKVQRLRPFPPDASFVGPATEDGYTRLDTFGDVLELLN